MHKNKHNYFVQSNIHINIWKVLKIQRKCIKSRKKQKNVKLKMIDLCAGTGAFSYAFESTNMVDVVFANDYEESSKTIYDHNFNHELTAGFPCQPFSIAGKRKGF